MEQAGYHGHPVSHDGNVRRLMCHKFCTPAKHFTESINITFIQLIQLILKSFLLSHQRLLRSIRVQFHSAFNGTLLGIKLY